ncbi:DsbA family protein [Reyranella sp.]|uniref:DsbA family protein n=1 Tax=Reyranella sp. TaxID=1929291 RepID=UPI003BABD54B
MTRRVDLWIDLRSPYSFLAKDPAYALEAEFGVELVLRPFSLEIASAAQLGDPASLARGMRKIKYLYADARRFAKPRGITLLGPKKIFDQKLVHLAWLYAARTGHDRALIDLAFPRFFKRELDYEDRAAIVGLLQDAGVDAAGFDAYAAGEGPAELDGHQREAEAQGVFAVPTFVVEGELFWGQDRIDFVRGKLAG